MSHTRDVFRRLAMLGLALCVLIAGGTVAYALVEDRNLWDGFVWTIDTVATTGSIQAPQDTAGEIVKVDPDAARRRDAVLRAGLDDRARRDGRVGHTAVRTARAQDDRATQRPLHRLRLRPGGPPGGERPARGGRAVRRDRRGPEEPRGRVRAGRALHHRPAVRRRGAARRRHRPRPRDRRLRRLRRREHLHRPDRARAAPGHRDRRPRQPRGEREQAAARRRRPRDLAVQVLGHRDGPARPASERDGDDGRRRRVPARGDHRPGRLGGRRADGRRRPRRVLHRRRPVAPTAPSGRSPRPTRCWPRATW